MTHQEAIGCLVLLRQIAYQTLQGIEFNDGRKERLKRDISAIDMSLEALKFQQRINDLGLTFEDINTLINKNKPKKLEYSEWYPNDRDCPNCHSNLVSYDGSINNCPFCGQALGEGVEVIK